MIQIKDLVFSYGKESFTEISELNFRDGEFNVIIGENGSGKTTLLNLPLYLQGFAPGSWDP